jgi:hypothetical protein
MVKASVDPDLALTAGYERELSRVEKIDFLTERPSVESS